MARTRFQLGAVTEAILRRGALLIFPIQNRKEPPSVWSEFFPNTPMRWEWDDSADNRVVQLWRIKTELSSTGKVVYTKWYQNKATALAPDVFSALATLITPAGSETVGLSASARDLLQVLESDSPLSSKNLKKMAGLGGARSSDYEKGMRELWSRCLIVALGEVEDGAFPSLEIGATSVVQEALWKKSRQSTPASAHKVLLDRLGENSYFYKEYSRLLKRRTLDLSPSPVSLPQSVTYEELMKKGTRKVLEARSSVGTPLQQGKMIHRRKKT